MSLGSCLCMWQGLHLLNIFGYSCALACHFDCKSNYTQATHEVHVITNVNIYTSTVHASACKCQVKTDCTIPYHNWYENYTWHILK